MIVVSVTVFGTVLFAQWDDSVSGVITTPDNVIIDGSVSTKSSILIERSDDSAGNTATWKSKITSYQVPYNDLFFSVIANGDTEKNILHLTEYGNLNLTGSNSSISIFRSDDSAGGQATWKLGISAKHAPYNDLVFNFDNGSGFENKFIITADGNIGIGTIDPSNKLDVVGTISATNYSCSSDIRYKHSITPISHALQKLMALNGVFYNWKTEKYKNMNFSKDRQIGFIAQEVEKVVPELVYTDSKGYKSMSYNKLTAVIVEAMKEMKSVSDAKISSLEKENLSLKKRIASLEKVNERVAALERMMEGKRVVLR